LKDILTLRGGAKKARGKTATLSKSNKTATGKVKVGAKQKAEKDNSVTSSFLQKYHAMLPLTRVYMTMIAICTIVGVLLGEEMAQAVLTLDPMRTLYGGEIWRPVTAASYFGKPSIGALMSAYYLFEYGSTLERAYGSAQFLVFMLLQLSLLTVFSMLFRQPVFGNSMVTAMLHVLSRAMPNQKVRWLVMNVPYWSLPYCTMLADCLQAGSAAAALPHILGILSGHFYQFHKFVWPKVGGEDWLSAPNFLIERMDPNAASKSAAKESLSKALKARKRGKGKKLGR
jgi:membrane associated rhomboid family serine protease